MTESLNIGLDLNNKFNRLAFVSAYGAILLEVAFSYTFPFRRTLKKLEFIIISVVSVVIVAMSTQPMIAGEVTLENGELMFSVGPFLWLYSLAFLFLGLIMMRNLLSAPKDADVTTKNQARLIFIAFVSSAALGLSFSVLIPLFSEEWHTAQYGPPSTILLVLTIVYAIVRHKLFNVRAVIVRTVAYTLSLASLAVVYYILVLAISKFIFKREVSQEEVFISIFLAFILIIIAPFVKKFFDTVTNKVFYKQVYDSDEFHARISKILTDNNDMRSMLQQVTSEISRTLKSEQAVVFVYNGDRHMSTGTKQHSRIPLEDVQSIDIFAKGKGVSTITNNHLGLRRMMLSHRIEIILPIFRDDQVIAYLFLGEHKGRSRYSERDLKVLESIADELSIAIQNTLVVHEVRRLNETLHQRIESSTRELRESNEQLQKLDEAKDEFISMASHQLRTPLTSIKGYISMMLDGDAGKINETQHKFLREVFVSSERMVHLVNDFLSVSRLQTGKFVVDKKVADITKTIRYEIDSLEQIASQKNITLETKLPTKPVQLFIDEGKISQVIMNLVDNAIHYSKDNSTIVVELKVVKDKIEFSVKDTGIGVPKEAQKGLFEKFYRADNARKQRPDGTGVGLYLAKKIVDAHQGGVIFKSTEGKGSTFGFSLTADNSSQTK